MTTNVSFLGINKDADVASTVNAIRKFSDKQNKEIIIWLKELDMISNVIQLDNYQQKKLVITKLSGPSRL